MRKELTCYITTNEEGEEASVQRVAADPTFIMLRLGPNIMVLNKGELLEAIGSIEYHSAMFDEEVRRAANKLELEASRAAAAQRQAELAKTQPAPAAPKKTGGKVATPKGLTKEDANTIVLDQDFSQGPTESEIKLANMMKGLPSGGVVKE